MKREDIRNQLIELLESVPAAQRLYPDLFVDMLMENNVTIVVKCKDCRSMRQSDYALEFDGKTPLCECSYSSMVNRPHEYCSWGEKRKQPVEKCATCKKSDGKGYCRYRDCEYEPKS